MRGTVFSKRIVSALCVSLVALSCFFTMTAFARENIDTGREASISIYFGEDGEGFPGVSFYLYHVASVSEDGSYTLTEDFKQYSISLDGLDSSGWRALAQTLDAYAARDNLEPLQVEETGQNGRAVFTGLSTGLYLVTGTQYTDGTSVYTPEPILVSVPGAAEDGWDYDIEASCKFEKEDLPAELTSRRVQKVWDDDGCEDKRPDSILVQLLENGETVDTVVLSQENNWEYTWNNLDGSSEWQVVEADVPDSYTVTVAQEGNLYIITNSLQPELTEEPPDKLPQTGMLWWPVPLLLCVGLLLVVVGVIVRRKRGDQDDE